MIIIIISGWSTSCSIYLDKHQFIHNKGIFPHQTNWLPNSIHPYIWCTVKDRYFYRWWVCKYIIQEAIMMRKSKTSSLKTSALWDEKDTDNNGTHKCPRLLQKSDLSKGIELVAQRESHCLTNKRLDGCHHHDC